MDESVTADDRCGISMASSKRLEDTIVADPFGDVLMSVLKNPDRQSRCDPEDRITE